MKLTNKLNRDLDETDVHTNFHQNRSQMKFLYEFEKLKRMLKQDGGII